MVSYSVSAFGFSSDIMHSSWIFFFCIAALQICISKYTCEVLLGCGALWLVLALDALLGITQLL